MPAALLLVAADLPKEGDRGYIPSTPDLGKAEAQCRANEPGPAVLMRVEGLKDRQGNLKSELYPSNDDDFLADDNLLVMAGKTFRRIEVPVPKSGEVVVCIRLPGPGAYSLILLHDRDGNRKFGLSTDGIAFPGNPKLGLSKPKAAAARIEAGAGLTRITVRMNYRRGLFGFGPLRDGE
ncbi:DUF2141 domain-containing protein [Polymorphobacter sp.]|uniref:DUF2141 domain-containing protein n=1 Tax=Polymorphobacter sp. TaxID=1909290 RepID=UPI003F7077F6